MLFCFTAWHEAKQQRQTAERMRRLQASRPAVSGAEIAQGCSADVPPEVAERVLSVLAAVSEFSLSPPGAEVAPSRLRPGDLLVGDLAYDLDSLAFYELETRLEKEFGVRIRLRDFPQSPTVGDVVQLVASKLQVVKPA